MNTEQIQVSSLNSDPANARKHSDRNIDAIKASLARFGQQKPIVVDANNVVRAGNGTLEAAKALGWEEISVVRSGLEGSEMSAFAIADNRTAELAEWDEEILAATMNGLRDDGVEPEQLGFSAEEMASVMEAIADTSEVLEDEVPELPEDPITQPGDLWTLGNHRLLCGDCASAQAVTTLLDGQKINLAISSPPYASQRKYDETSPFKPIHPDEYLDWFEPVQANIAQHLADDGSWFLNIKEHCEEGQRHLYVKDLTLAHVRRWGWMFAEEFVWSHPGMPKAPRLRFKNGWEPIFQFTRGRHKFRPDEVRRLTGEGQVSGMKKKPKTAGHASSYQGAPAGAIRAYRATLEESIGSCGNMAYPSNVLSLGNNGEALGHSAAYPVSLPEFFLKAYSDEGDIVYDPFLGSGTTLVAAEQLGRRCYGMEISPGHCDVIVKRWENLTDGKAVR
jgi:DNA modification methylase